MTAIFSKLAAAPFWRNFWMIAAAITGLRVLTLLLTPLGIGPDEAQYWYWSRDLDVGYYSKPPLIAWAIALTTGLFGNDGWAVRLSAPFFHAGAAAFLYLAAKRLYDERAAFWTGLGWLLMPGVLLSSFIMATDAPLLFFWSAGLYFLARIIDAASPRLADFAALGAAIGLGLMSKYAMVYFPLALAVSLLSKPVRAKLLAPPLALTGVIAAAIFAPNMIWNAQHDFQTLSHTADNADWGAQFFHPLAFLEYFGGQFAVFGIIPFAALLYIVSKRGAWRMETRDFTLLVFALTPLVIVGVQALLSRAHANWAAASYPAALLLVTGWLLREKRWGLVKFSAFFHAFLLLVFTAGVLAPRLIDRAGLAPAVRDLRGWKEQSDDIMSYAAGYDAVLVDDRYLMGEMLYHQKDSPVEIAALDVNASVDNHYEAFRPFDPARMKRVLFVTVRSDAAHVDYRFRRIKKLGSVEAAPGAAQRRSYTLYELSEYFGKTASQRSD
ncbi:ArnT family glycosyltransferase [Hyphococcus sp.]|jgi:4-amino-4-deoxy-L-arabinose transferase-like glycosyltransferase|uniref:ArnT family glycosyltransferase n=1 Tax=Hyphococcus sp. TaxID=2038636 RepID=UPI003D095B11